MRKWKEGTAVVQNMDRLKENVASRKDLNAIQSEKEFEVFLRELNSV